MNELTTKKSGRINQRISGYLRARMDAAYANYGVSDAVMVEDSLLALLDCVEATGHYRRPMKMIWAGGAPETQWIAAEDAAEYPAKPGDGGKPRD